MFLTNDFYQCYSLMNEWKKTKQKKNIKFVHRECFEETLLTNDSITS